MGHYQGAKGYAVNDDNLLDSAAAARFLGLRSPGTLANWRSQGRGPAFVKVGSSIRYLQGDLTSWVRANRMSPGKTGLRPQDDGLAEIGAGRRAH